MSQSLVLASNNAKKLKELGTLLEPLGYSLVPQGALHILEADEPFETFVENALAKARHAAGASGMPAIADDSGLCVPALGGAPGVHSAYYAIEQSGSRSDAANNQKVLRAMESFRAEADRAAYFICLLVAVRSANDPSPLIAEGRLHGKITRAPRGDGDFGYSPILELPSGKTVAEISQEDKNKISHRAHAVARMQELIKTNWLG
jgi:XTP/dITP diphosphohydrolase